MKEKINQVAKGIFEYELPEIVLSEEKIEFSVEEGKTYRGCLTLSNSEHRFMKGVLYSSNAALTFPKTTFTGEEVTISYEYKSPQERKMGEKEKGKITIVTNFGERELPFEAMVISPFVDSRVGKIRDMNQLVELAKVDMMQAIHIFKSHEFRELLAAQEEEKLPIYQSFMKSPSAGQSLEEFLIATEKKKSIYLSLEKEQVVYTDVSASFQDSVQVKKEEWGYLEGKITSDVEFIIPEHSTFWAEEFEENKYTLGYTVDAIKLKPGMNIGHLVISTPKQTLRYEVKAERFVERNHRSESERNKRHYEAELLKRYLEFRLDRVSKEDYISGMEFVLRHLIAIEPRTEYRLWMIHLDLVAKREDELQRIMNTFMDQEEMILGESLQNYLAYLYLKASYTEKEEDGKKALETIRDYQDGELDDWKLLWYQLQLDPRFEKEESRLQEIMYRLQTGETTPVLYYEASEVYKKSPQLLQELGRMEQRIMHWAIREGNLTDELADQYVYLATRVRGYHQKVYYDLCSLYERKESKECLIAILRLLITNRKTDSRYFKWYQLGVRKQVKVTELYEYYMYAYDESEKEQIDHQVLLYFVYNNHLQEKKKSFLYAYLIEHKEEDPEMYSVYRSQIISFAKRMLQKGAITWNLTKIYTELLKEEKMEDSLIDQIVAVLFRNQVTCTNPKMTGIVVVEEALKEEQMVSFSKGQALVTILSEDARIYLLDEWGNRYVGKEDYTICPMMQVKEWFSFCFENNRDNLYLVLYALKNQKTQEEPLQEEDVYRKSRLLEEDCVSDEYKGRWYVPILNYYAKTENMEKLDEYLPQVQLEFLKEKERITVIQYYILRQLYEKAYLAIGCFGFEQVAPKYLQKLVLVKLEGSNEELDDEEREREEYLLLRMCYYLLNQGYATAPIMTYLCNHYIASTKVLLKIWKQTSAVNINTAVLEERLLGQMIFSETLLEESYPVFVSYYPHAQNKSLVRSYLNRMAYTYLIRKEPIEEEIFEIIRKESLYHESRVCIYALLERYSKSAAEGRLGEVIDPDSIRLLDYNLHKYIKEGRILPCFKKYGTCFAIPEVLYDRQFIEYIGNPKNKVWIHYRMQSEDIREEQYTKEPLDNIYEGIYSKSFLLFYGETIQYFITEETKNGEKMTQLAKLTQTEEPMNPRNRYGKLNRMLVQKEKNELERLEEQMKQYMMEEFVTSSLFKPL